MTGGTVIGRDSRLRWAAVAAALAVATLALGLLASAPASAGPATYKLKGVGKFDTPVHADDDGAHASLLFVVEQPGQIQVVRDGETLGKPFLDIREKVRFSGEQGLLSVAFDPGYADNRRFYVYYVNNEGDIRVDQFRAKSAVRARASSRKKVIVVGHDQADNHNGGQLQFGPDGYLYMGTGDGGPQQDPEDDAQSTGSLLGKLLRIDPVSEGGYEIPADNPFAGGGGEPEIYAVGLRNPFRFSFDSDNGALTIGDVGGSEWEEVDYRATPEPGMNFGWNDFEGLHETSFGTGANADPKVDPIFEYANSGQPTCAITGGYVVRDPGLPGLAGQYLFADFCQDGLRTIQVPSGNPGTSVNLSPPSVSSFGEGADGQIYVVSLEGKVWRLEQASP